MSDVGRNELFQRYAGNPILTARMWPETVNAVFNPGVARVGGETVLLARVEDRAGISQLWTVRSEDGLTGWRIAPTGLVVPEPTRHAEEFGVEDVRITRAGDEHLLVYTGYSRDGPVVCLGATRDFVTFERRGVLMPPEDKDAALFPRPFDGRWALIHRPVSATPRHAAHIWLSWSPDLRHWGDHRILLRAREGAWWDAHKIGLCGPPLETPAGWLLLYHGVHTTSAGAIYRLGLALLDRDDPEVVRARGREWVFGPDAPYERSGDVAQVVFSCGWDVADDGDTVRMYYGAADTSVCVATTTVSAMLRWLERHPS